MARKVPPGYYRDRYGRLQRDRRKSEDRRSRNQNFDQDRRYHMRRASDREMIEREHRQMMEDALEEFAADHAEDPT